jgi:hypothetical protein
MSQNDFLRLLEVPQKDRDIQWEENFLKTFPQCQLTLIDPGPQVGPDHFPYMFVEIDENSAEPAMKLLQWIATKGVGLAVNPKKNYPDFVFTYGMIWNFFKSGAFLQHPAHHHVHGPNCNHDHSHDDSHDEKLKQGSTIYVGVPTESYLPKDVRAILKEFLKQQGVMAPKITMISTDQVNFDLCFSIESFGSPDNTEHEGILQGLSWFLPAHYSLAFVSEKGLPPFEEI